MTVEQFQRFLKDHDQYEHETRSILKQYSPDPGRAVDRCQLVRGRRLLQLAERAGGLPEDQWCYLPNEPGPTPRG